MVGVTYYGRHSMTWEGFLAMVVIIVLLLLVNRRGWARTTAALEATIAGIAGRLGGRVVEGRWAVPSRIEFSAEGRRAVLDYNGDEAYDGVTRVTVDLRGVSPGMLLVFRESFRSTISKLFGAQDLLVGSHPFDERYVVQAKPEGVADKIFARERRAQVVESVGRLYFLPDATIHLTRETLTVRARGYLRKERELWALARTAIDFTRYVLELTCTPGISWGETRTEGGECQICGSALRLAAGVVQCSRCRTPHHLECWKYNGRCSTFACGETRYTRV
jgi:hypothetical protein